MQDLGREVDGVFVGRWGTIMAAIAMAIALSTKENRPIAFEFNGVIVTVCSDSNLELIYRDYSRALHGYIDRNVGPNPNPVLTDEERASDAHIQLENELKEEMEREEYARARIKAIKAKLANEPSDTLNPKP